MKYLRTNFNEQLEFLKNEMTMMGEMCESALNLAVETLESDRKDAEKTKQSAEHVIEISHEIDQKERDIQSSCFKLLLKQQPVATDLRIISAALKMITDMERIGDQAEDIAEIVTYLGDRTIDDAPLIAGMARETIAMVNDSVAAYVEQNTTLAEEVIARDDVVDEYFDRIKRSLIEMIAKNPTDGEFAIDLLMIAKYFERIGDHATNIAEWVIYSVTGVGKEVK